MKSKKIPPSFIDSALASGGLPRHPTGIWNTFGNLHLRYFVATQVQNPGYVLPCSVLCPLVVGGGINQCCTLSVCLFHVLCLFGTGYSSV